MSYSCHSIREQVNSQFVDESWRKCEEILAFMATFSLSARNSLQFLQVTHQHIVQNYSGLFSRFRLLMSILIWFQLLPDTEMVRYCQRRNRSQRPISSKVGLSPLHSMWTQYVTIMVFARS